MRGNGKIVTLAATILTAVLELILLLARKRKT